MRQRERAGNGTDQHRDATHGGCSDDHLLHAEVGGAKVVIRNLTQRNVNRHGSNSHEFQRSNLRNVGSDILTNFSGPIDSFGLVAVTVHLLFAAVTVHIPLGQIMDHYLCATDCSVR